MIGYSVAFGSGLLVGWLLFKRPQWVSAAFNALRAKIGW
jgi:hypothetical protein